MTREYRFDLNNAVLDLAEGLTGLRALVCECARPRCEEVLLLDAVEAGGVRRTSSCVIVHPEHADEVGGGPVEQTERYVIVDLEPRPAPL
jgi:hypothetical protein